MKKVYTTLIGLILTLTGFSQSCLPEGIIFSTQAQIENFQVNYPNCTQIEGDVTINGEDITNLNGLDVVTYIGGNLFIGTFFYGGNSVLTNLTGLEGLTEIAGSVGIHQNPVLTSLTGLDNLTSIGLSLSIYGNPLNSLAGLANLTSIGGGLSISRNYTLTSLMGLENLTTIGGGISITENDSLTSLTGLDKLAVASVDDLSIYDNSALSNCSVQSICDYLASPNGVVIVENNSSGCNTPPEIADGCGITLPCLPYGNYYFNTQAEIDNFHTNYSECSNLQGNVQIYGDNITNLNGLVGVTSVGGDLFIESNDSLISIEGLGSVNSVGGDLYIGYNDALPHLTGLNNLISVGHDFWIVHNVNLTSITGLTALSTIGRHLTINGNIILTSLTGLEGLNYIGGTLTIGGDYMGNPLLTSLTGLDNLTSVGGYLSIHNNNSLTSLTGLDNIDTGSISGLFIHNNIILSTCAVQSICDYLVSPNGYYDLYDNATGCNSPAEVDSACVYLSNDELKVQPAFAIYPNPSSTAITISTPATIYKNTFMTVYNINGQQIMTRQITEQQTVVDVSGLVQGVYFVKVTDDRTIQVGKFIKE
jgi:UDP-3-O-[3-hydroxymyristoyl] glucosamine N-acyltransferase